MISTMLVSIALAGAAQRGASLSVTFPDRSNPNFYNVMSCVGAARERTKLHVGKDGIPSPKSGKVVFRCSGPLTTQIRRIPFEPVYFLDTGWSWSFEDVDGREVLAGDDAKLMKSQDAGLRFYVREGYRER